MPYSIDALEPYISARTLGFHYGKHLQGYVDNLNNLIIGTEFEDISLEEIVARSDGQVFNNAGQILNHNLYFTQFRPYQPLNRVEGALFIQIEKQWGTFEAFKKDFEIKGAGLFGSGWVWLQADESGELLLTQYAGAGNPVAYGHKPILTFDVWEHAYYLDYQNRRPAYLSALWNIVDWNVLEGRYLRK